MHQPAVANSVVIAPTGLHLSPLLTHHQAADAEENEVEKGKETRGEPRARGEFELGSTTWIAVDRVGHAPARWYASNCIPQTPRKR